MLKPAASCRNWNPGTQILPLPALTTTPPHPRAWRALCPVTLASPSPQFSAVKLLKSLGLGSRNPVQHRGIRNGSGLCLPAKRSSPLRGSPLVQEVAPSLGPKELGFSSLKTLLACQEAKTHRLWCHHVNLHSCLFRRGRKMSLREA